MSNTLTQKEKDKIQERVENMTSDERRNKLQGYVKEFLIKTIFAHMALLGYSFFTLYLNDIYNLNLFLVIIQIGFGVLLIRICMLLYQALLFFRNANNLAKSFDKGISAGMNYINEMSEDE